MGRTMHPRYAECLPIERPAPLPFHVRHPHYFTLIAVSVFAAVAYTLQWIVS